MTSPQAPAGESRAVVRADEPVNAAMATLRRKMLERGMNPDVPPAEDEDRPDDPGEYQAAIRRQAWVNSLRLAGHHEYEHWTLDQLHEQTQHRDALARYVQTLITGKRLGRRPKILNMVLPGGVGTGKTTAATAVGAEAARGGLMTRFLKHSLYLTWLRPGNAPSGLTETMVRERVERVDLLILDELCGEMSGPATEAARRESVALIDSRLAAGRATLVTTNRTSDEIEEIMGSPFLSRLGARAQALEFVGEDLRRPLRWGTPRDRMGQIAPRGG